MSCRPADISHDTALLKHQQHGGVKTVFSDSKHLKGTVKGSFISLHVEGNPRYETTVESVFIKWNLWFLYAVNCNTYLYIVHSQTNTLFIKLGKV